MEDKTNRAYWLAGEYAMKTNRAVFITGKAGTGKTTFLRRLREETSKTLAVVAPTGVAAINAGGMTIHSLFQLPVRTIVPTEQSYKQLFTEQRLTQRKRNMLYHLEMLVIDEVSMVRADVMDAMDRVLRRYKYKRDVPFGGVQVIMIGDLFQLSPVVKQGEEEEMMSKYYEGPYFFQSKVMQELQPVYIELDKVFRQRDERFVQMLNEVRENRLSEVSRAILNARYIKGFKNSDADFHITLTTHNRLADEINERELRKIERETEFFDAEIKKDFPMNIYPTDEKLCLKIGARVMFIRNDDQKPRRFYNGKIGVVKEIKGDRVIVECERGNELAKESVQCTVDGVQSERGNELAKEEIEVGRMEWTNIRYREDEKTGKIEEEVLGSFRQFPLRLAWAVTIHKSQGLTFDKVIIDASRAFAAGQVYVALSRCRTIEGIVLSSPLANVKLDNDPSVIQYTNKQPDIDWTTKGLAMACKEYEVLLFDSLFDFRRPLALVEQMLRVVDKAVSFNAVTRLYIEGLKPEIEAWQDVADKFKPQLQSLLVMGDKAGLSSRVHAAVRYYIPLLEKMAKHVAEHPCRSKNKGDVADFEPLLSDLFLGIHEKMHLMRAMEKEAVPSGEGLMDARGSFEAPIDQFAGVYDKPVSKRKGKERLRNEGKERLREDRMENDVDAMIRDMLSEGKPSRGLMEFVQMMQEKKREMGVWEVGKSMQVKSKPEQAGARWMIEDDLRLREMFARGERVADMAREFNRTYGAIRARLKKLGLVE